MRNEKSVGYYVWKAKIERPFVVRATVGNVANERVGSYATIQEAFLVAEGHEEATVQNAISGQFYSHADLS